MRVVVTEKPSVARDLARVLGVRGKHQGYLEGEGMRITWCYGHLLQLEDPAHYDGKWRRWRLDTLPMVPERFELKVRKGARDQWAVVRRLLRDRGASEVVNACDAGREGELIFRWAYEQAECRLPVRRLWLSSLTDTAIRHAWGRLRPGGELDALADAARCRAEADWLVGLNSTRAMTCLARQGGGDQLLSVGRVQTPTLAMIVERDRAIEAFEPEPFWQVKARFAAKPDATWQGTWFRQERKKDKETDEVPRAERLAERAHAEAIAAAARDRTGEVEKSGRRKQRDKPPLLYDLTALQRRANQRYSLSAAKTLEIAQALYEKHKLISYPRTDARYLTPDQVAELPDIVRGLGGLAVYAPFATALLHKPIQPGKRVVDASEVGDHHAIIPTGRTPSSSRLSPDEKRVFDLVARRLLAALSPDAVFERTELIVAVDPGDAPLPDDIVRPLRFRARGRVCVEPGWRAVDPPPSKKEVLLPLVAAGAEAAVAEVEPVEGRTRPPRPFTDASILQAMETAGKHLDDAELKRAMRGAGLGTPATRAAILQTLLRREFVVRDAKHLRSTERGRGLIDAVPVDDLKSAELTGRWEARLSAIAEGRDARADFMRDVVTRLGTVIDAIAAAEPPPAEVTRAPDTPVLGDCPVCGTPVREGRSVFSCETGRACAFVVFKTMSKRAISARTVRQLLRDKRSKPLKGFRSKKGKTFEAGLTVRDDGSVGFWFPGREPETPARPPEVAATPVGRPCPSCGHGRLIAGRTAWGCDRWRDGCRFTLPYIRDGQRLTEAEAVALLA